MFGMVVDDTRSHVQHAMFIGEKATNCFGKIARVSASSWGIRFSALRYLFSGIYVAVLCYDTAVWYHRSSIFPVKRIQLRTQRPALFLLIKAYRSISSAALLPADLEVFRVG